MCTDPSAFRAQCITEATVLCGCACCRYHVYDHGEDPLASRRRLSITRRLWAWLGRQWSRLSNMLSSFRRDVSRTLINTVRAVPHVVAAVATGNIGTGGARAVNLPLWQWQCLAGQHAGGGGGSSMCETVWSRRNSRHFRGQQTRFATTLPLDMTGSFFRLQPGVRFELDITRWNLRKLVVAIRGHAEFAAIAKLTSTITASVTRSFKLVESQIGTNTLHIGPVPFLIHSFLHLNLVVRIEGTLAGLLPTEMTMGATGRSDVEYGVGLRRDARDNIEPFRISKSDWKRTTWGPEFQPTSSATRARVVVSLEPSLFISINWIGGPTATIAPYVATEFDTNGWPTAPGSRQDECGLSIGWGFDVFVGAYLVVRNPLNNNPILRRELGFTTVTSIPMQQLWGCDCDRQCEMA